MATKTKVGKSEKKTHKIRAGSVTIPVSRHPKGGWRFGWKEDGKWKYRYREDLSQAKKLALAKAMELDRGEAPLAGLKGEKAKLVRQILEMCPTEKDLLKFRDYMTKGLDLKVTVEDAAKGFLAFKKEGEGESRNLETLAWGLRKLVADFGPRGMATLTAGELNKLLLKQGIPRTRLNLRRALVTFFRWCQTMKYLDRGTPTEMEQTAKVKVAKKTPDTYTPEELKTMLDNVGEAYRGWLVIGAFMGVRSAEIMRMDWSMFKWTQGKLELPVEVTKTKDRRLVDIPEAVTRWIPDPPKSGPVCAMLPNQVNRGKVSETSRLGTLVGGWKKNGLRHSWASYRCAQVGFVTTAMEAGNSETMIRGTYRDAKTEEEARDWFDVIP